MKSAKKSHKSPADYAKRLKAYAKLGHSAPKVTAALKAEGFEVAERSVSRALSKLRGRQRMSRKAAPPTPPAAAAPAPPPVADPPPPPAGEIPTEEQIANADLATLESWLELAGRSAKAAEARGDAPAVARFGTFAVSIFEAIRKAKPKEERPEGYFMTEADQDAADKKNDTRLDALEKACLKERATWPVCPHCQQPVRPPDYEQRLAEMSEAGRLVSALLDMGVDDEYHN